MKRFFNQRNFALFCLTILFLNLFQILYFQRDVFLRPYDVAYWEDRVAHSQWFLPISKRIIGDDGLFAYVGYKLVSGADPSGLNAETPPVGKYLIGLSILIFNNASYAGLFLGIGSLVLFYFLSGLFLKEQSARLFFVALLSLDPLFFTQFWNAWVDMTQLFFLLGNILIFLKLLKANGGKRLFLALMAGVLLGLFSQTKLAILLPIIFSLEGGYLFFRRMRKEIFFVIFAAAVTILAVYTKYFLLGNSLFDFLRLQKYILNFYIQSQLEVHIAAIWSTLILGKFPDIVGGIPTTFEEWSLLWPLITILGIAGLLGSLVTKQTPTTIKGISLFVIFSFFVFTFIPSYPRYLLILLPFLYLFAIHKGTDLLPSRSKSIIPVMILLFALVNSFIFLQRSPDSRLERFFYNLSHQYFQDIYHEDLAKASLPSVDRKAFREITQQTLLDATVKALEIEELERNTSRFSEGGLVKIKIRYKTADLGFFEEEKVVELVKENGQWKVWWDWDILLDKFRPTFTIESNTIYGNRGSLFDAQGNVLAQDTTGYLIEVRPEEIDQTKEETMVNVISNVGKNSKLVMQNIYLENPLPNSFIPIATTYVDLTEKQKNLLSSFPSLRLTPFRTRHYYKDFDPQSIQNTEYLDETRIYSSYNYHGIRGVEMEHDARLWGFSGGSLFIRDGNGNNIRKIIEKVPKNGEDITVNL